MATLPRGMAGTHARAPVARLAIAAALTSAACSASRAANPTSSPRAELAHDPGLARRDAAEATFTGHPVANPARLLMAQCVAGCNGEARCARRCWCRATCRETAACMRTCVVDVERRVEVGTLVAAEIRGPREHGELMLSTLPMAYCYVHDQGVVGRFSTPRRITLPRGRYYVHCHNGDLGVSSGFWVAVQPGQSTRVIARPLR